MKFFNTRFSLFLSILFLSVVSPLSAQDPAAPVIAGDFADPSIIKAGDKYYAVATSSEWAPHFPIYSSADLKNWKQEGYVFNKMPDWTSGSFWAPEYFFQNNTYYIFYTARRKLDNVSCIGVATSKFPDKDFKDQGIVVAYGKEAIDGFVFSDQGQLYITFKAYGLDGRPIEILGSKLSADGLKMEGEVFSMLKDDQRLGMEGQSLLKKDSVYYLFYSAGNCCGMDCSYDVRVARGTSIKGPYEKYQGVPLLQEGDYWKCPGHGTFVKNGNDAFYYLYHAYNKRSNVFTGRQGMLAKLSWNGNNEWPSLAQANMRDSTSDNITDDFNGKAIANYWQYDFRNANPVVKQKKGRLSLSGDFKATNHAGVVLTVRPALDAFEMETTVSNNNDALKGLAFYGDAHAAIGVGVIKDKVEFWMIKDNKRSVIDNAILSSKSPVKLKFVTDANRSCKVFYKQEGNDWIEMTTGPSTSTAFLPQWDRSPRAGLNFKGAAGLDAQFEDFVIRY